MKSLLTLQNVRFLLVNAESLKRFDYYEKRMHRVFRDTQVLRWGSISRHTIENTFLCFLFYCANNSVKDVAKLLRSISNHINVERMIERSRKASGMRIPRLESKGVGATNAQSDDRKKAYFCA